jgi:glycine dehydrogenase
MTYISDEVRKVESGEWELSNNPLQNSPHTLADITDTWGHGYTIKEAVFPAPAAADNKFWPTVNRIDDV